MLNFKKLYLKGEKMNKVKIIADSCSSLTPSELKMLDVDFVQMSFVVNGEAYNAFDNDFDNPQEFYKK